MGVRRFEDLVVWQKARSLCVEIYGITAEGPFARDYALRDQVRRAAVSIMSNVAEGFERSSQAEFARFLAIARGSAAELKSQLYLAHDLGYVADADSRVLVERCSEIARMLISLRRTLRT